MKVVILAGGYGSRISEESTVRPKPMVEIGGKPILWHIMKIFARQGFNEFIICCGYKSQVIKDYFRNYSLYLSDVTFDLKNHRMQIHRDMSDDWKVTLVETGDDAMTGGRLLRVKDYIDNDSFFFTYGDGVGDIDLKKLLKFHQKQKVYATLTAVQSPGRFGAFTLAKEQPLITKFREKPNGDGAWINGGFFVLGKEIFKYIDNEKTTWEQEPLRLLARDKKLAAYKHNGFWQCMDTLRDKHVLEDLWQSGNAPWKIWK